MATKDKEKEKHPVRHVWKNVKLAMRLLWRVDKRIVVFWVILLIIGSAIPIAVSYSFKLLIDALSHTASTKSIIITGVLGALALRTVLDAISNVQATIRRDWIGRVLRFKFEEYFTYSMAEKISQLDVQHLENAEIQNLIRKAQNSDSRITIFIENTLYLFMNLTTVIASALLLIPYGFWIPLVLLALAVPRFILRTRQSKVEWWIGNLNTPEVKELDYISGLLSSAGDLKEVRVAQAASALLKKMRKIQRYLVASMQKPLRKHLQNKFYLEALEDIAYFGLAYTRIPLAASGALTAGGFTFFLSLMDRILGNIQGMLSNVNDMYEQNLYLDYYFDLMALQPILKIKSPGIKLDEIAPPTIEFRNVSFTYPDGTPSLKNISFTFRAGEHLAIVGPNGAGKSTLIKLLLRFYDVTSGQILINDQDLRDLQPENWFKFVSILFQDFTKFMLTIDDNITFGRDEPDHKRVEEAARQSGAHDFIQNLPKKYKQRLGKRFEDSAELSQGQWQKLALARIFYEAAPLLILDEPTSAIDAEAEAEIFNNLYRLYQGKSLLLVSHRFSTVKQADHIIVLQRGKLAEEGDHVSLMKEDGVYARMFNVQAKGYLD